MKQNFIIVGAGRMGVNHIKAALNLGVLPVAICDLNSENCFRAAELCGISNDSCFSNLEQLLSSVKKIDFAIVATTTDARSEAVIKLAKHGVPAILCEKPMASSVEECDLMIAACNANKTKLAVNHQMRFMGAYKVVKEELESGAHGSLTSMSVVGGNIGIAMNGSHYFEAFRWLSGSDIQCVSAWFSGPPMNNPRGKLFFDQSGESRIVSSNGHRLFLNVGCDQGHGMTVTYATNFGYIFIDELAGVGFSATRKREYKNLPYSRYGMPSDHKEITFAVADNLKPTQELMKSFLRDGDYADGISGKSVVATLSAIWCSAENGSESVDLFDLKDYHKKKFPWA